MQLVTVVSEEQPKEVLDDAEYEVSSVFSFGLMILSRMLLCVWNSVHESENVYLMRLL